MVSRGDSPLLTMVEPSSESSDAGQNVVISWTSVSLLEEERKLIQIEATNNCGKVTLQGRWGDFVHVSRTNFNKIHFPLTPLAAFNHTFSCVTQIFAFVTRHA